ncbi:MAG: cation-translocating P-type ATPase [Clostridiales bacterium]|nr:cation-translocating P-type ATPase [Clostridiales bacterium]
MAQKLTGLTGEEAARLLRENGENRVESGVHRSLLRLFAGQLGDWMTLILIVCAGISTLMGDGPEALAMLVIVVLNALIGFFQELRTERTLEALSQLAAPTARVIRDGVQRELPAAELVPGDLILVAAGDKIPADAHLLGEGSLSCDESMLTGESAPVEKSLRGDRKLCMGTLAVKGRGMAEVTATGMETEMGKIAGMLGSIEEEQTPLSARLEQLGRTIAAGCVALCGLMTLIGVLRGEDPFDMLVVGISLAVAAVPEGLPAIVTVSLAMAVRRILRRGSLVKHLHAVETLGCAQVICTDKTGTLTQNRMTVRELWTSAGTLEVTGEGYSREGSFRRGDRQAMELLGEEHLLLTAFTTCNASAITPGRSRSWKPDGEPTETALLIAAAKAGIYKGSGENLRSIRPFDSERKLMSVRAGTPEGEFVFVKGAPDVLLRRCDRYRREGSDLPLDAAFRRRVEQQGERLAGQGMRVIAAAYKPADRRDMEEGLVFLGLAAISDPPRPGAAQAVRECLSAHIRPIMITGDHRLTAAAIAREVGILRPGVEGVLTGEELDRLSDEQLRRQLPHTAVFARVTPAHKLRIVRAVKGMGEVTAMTGDGVNDAPALKEADIGVAMGESGSDVAREAADLILLDDDFSTLVAAVREGRTIYANIRRSIRYLLSCNIGEVVTMFAGMLMGMPVVLTPIQLLLVNLATDGLPAIALGFEPPEPDIMQRRPRGRDDSVFSNGLAGTILLRGMMIGLCTLGTYSCVFGLEGSREAAGSCALLTLIFTQLIHCFECKSERRSLFRIDLLSNLRLVGAVLVSGGMALLAVFWPPVMAILGTVTPDRTQALIVLGFCLLGPCLWAVAGELLAPRGDDTPLFRESLSQAEQAAGAREE